MLIKCARALFTQVCVCFFSLSLSLLAVLHLTFVFSFRILCVHRTRNGIKTVCDLIKHSFGFWEASSGGKASLALLFSPFDM